MQIEEESWISIGQWGIVSSIPCFMISSLSYFLSLSLFQPDFFFLSFSLVLVLSLALGQSWDPVQVWTCAQVISKLQPATDLSTMLTFFTSPDYLQQIMPNHANIF